MSWETYKPVKSSRVSTEPKVTIRNGKFSFNAYIRDNILSKYAFVTLMFDKKFNKIGIQLKREPDDTTLKISKTTKGGSAFLNSLSFFQQYGIDTSETRSYEVKIEKDDFLVIDLNKWEKVNYSPRTSKQTTGEQEPEETKA